MPRSENTFAPFDCQGIWWLPERNEINGTAGILRFSPEAGLTLELIGTLEKPSGSFGKSSHYPIIYGVTKGLKLGTFVTLVNSFRSTFSMASPGLSTETVRASEAYVGEHLSADGKFRFHSAEISTSYLSSWIVDSGIAIQHMRDPHHWHIEYKTPPSHDARVAEANITIHIGANLVRSIRSVSLEEHVVLRVNLEADVSPEVLNGSFVHPLQNLLSLATDRANAITAYRFFPSGSSGTGGDISFLYKPVYVDSSTKESLHGHEMLFSFRDVESSFEQLLTKWFTIYSELRSVFEVYFSLLYGKSSYVEPRFLTIVQAIRLYGEKRFGLSQKVLATQIAKLGEILPNLSPAGQAELRARVHPHEELVIHAGLSGLIQSLQPNIARLLVQPEATFIDEVLSIWPQNTRQTGNDGNRTASGATIYWCTQRLTYLFKAAILVELGFSIQKIEELFQRNRQVTQLGSLES